MSASRRDRELEADVIHLVGDIEGFVSLHLLDNRAEYDAAIVIAGERAQALAAARLTVLARARVLIVSSIATVGHGPAVVPTRDELAAAAKRDAERRDAWSEYRLDVDVREARRYDARKVLVVSATPAIVASTLRTTAVVPPSAYAIHDVARVLDVLAIFPMPNVIVLDLDLPGATELEATIRATYPLRFGAFDRVQFFSSKRGLRPEDTERILTALGVRMRPSRVERGPLAGVAILVVDEPGGRLDEEVFAIANGASVQTATGWEALEHLDAGRFDVVIAGEPRDVKLSSLARFVRRCEAPPFLVLAMSAPTSQRMRNLQPSLAHYFVERPLCLEDLLRVLER